VVTAHDKVNKDKKEAKDLFINTPEKRARHQKPQHSNKPNGSLPLTGTDKGLTCPPFCTKVMDKVR
jgi:hypothetical protein